MDLISVTQARKELPLVIDRVNQEKTEGVLLLRNSKQVGVVIAPDRYNRLIAQEDRMEDLEDALMVLYSDASDKGERVSLDELDQKYPQEG